MTGLTRRAAIGAAVATAGVASAPALAQSGQTEVQSLYPRYRNAYLDMLDKEKAHTAAEKTRHDLERAEQEYHDALDEWREVEIAILEAKATCREDAAIQIEVMRTCCYNRKPESDDECILAFTVAENLAALLA